MTVALFPGQGVQAPGMAAGLTEAAPETFAVASEILGVDVVRLCLHAEAGEATLDSTRWAQPAVLVCGVAAYRVLVDRGETFAAAAGHSVGEYAALVASGAVELADAIRLVAVRAEATDDAARTNPGTMAAVMRIEREAAERIIAEHGVALAADNGPGQFVVSGRLDAVARAVDALDRAGATCRRVDVAGAFHSQCMAPAVGRLAEALEETPITAPAIEVWSSTTAAPVSEPDEIRQALADQLTAPVRWRETVEGLAERHGPAFCDLGPGRVVAGLTRRIVDGADIRTISELVPA